QQVTLAATAGGTSLFNGWSGACTSDPCVVTMNADAAVTATFVPTFVLTAIEFVENVGQTPAGGSITSDGAPLTCANGSCTVTLAAGTNVTLTANPAAGYVFKNWIQTCTGPGTCQVTVNA